MTNWYTADTHFGHENVVRFNNRSFQSAGAMDAAIIENFWEYVTPEDDLWIVGDFAFGDKARDPETRALPWETVSHLAEVRDGARLSRTALQHPSSLGQSRYGTMAPPTK